MADAWMVETVIRVVVGARKGFVDGIIEVVGFSVEVGRGLVEVVAGVEATNEVVGIVDDVIGTTYEVA